MKCFDVKIKALFLYILAICIFYSSVVFLGNSLQPSLYQPHGVTDGWAEGYDGRVPDHSFNIDIATPAYYEWPINKYVGDLYKQGALPLWNPYQGTGTPLAAQYSSRVFFPYQILENISPVWTWDFFILGRLLIAGFFTFLFLQLIGLNFASAFLGGLIYMFSGSFVWFINLEQFTNSAMILPVHLYSLELLLKKNSLRRQAISALTFSLVLVAGQPEIALYILFLGACYYLFRQLIVHGREAIIRRITQYSLVVILGLSLATPLIFPFLELMENSHHLHHPSDGMGTRDTLQTFEGLRMLAPVVSETPQNYNPSTVSALTPAGEQFSYRIYPDNGAWDRLGGYTGIGALFLIAAGVSLSLGRVCRWRPLLLFFSIFGFVIILKNFGVIPFLWIGNLPLFDQVWSQRWAGPVWTFCLAAAAGFGFQIIEERIQSSITRKDKTRAIFLLAAVFSTLAGCFILLDLEYLSKYLQVAGPYSQGAGLVEGVKLLTDLRPYVNSTFLLGSIVTLLFLTLLFLSTCYLFKTRKGYYALIILIALELWWAIPLGYGHPGFYLKMVPLSIGLIGVSAFFLEKWRFAFVSVLLFFLSFIIVDINSTKGFPARHDFFKTTSYVDFVNKNIGYHRVMAGYGMLFPNFSSALGLQDVRFINSLAVDAFFEYKNKYLQKEDYFGHELWFTGRKLLPQKGFAEVPLEIDILDNIKHYSFLGVKYFIFPENGVSDLYLKDNPDFSVVYRGADAVIYQNARVMPRSFIVSNVQKVPSLQEAQQRMSDPDLDMFHDAFIELPAPEWFKEVSNDTGSGIVEIGHYEANSIGVQVDHSTGGLLVLTDAYYPGWRVYVDGESEDIYRVNGVVRGVFLKPGKHEVKFVYSPNSFRLGVVVFSAALLLIAVFIFKNSESRELK